MNAATVTVRVACKTQEAVDICSFELVDADGGALPPFSAGSHIDVHINSTLTRQYSLCNDPAESHRYLIGVLRDPGTRGGSNAMHDTVREGDLLKISEPKNHFPLAREGKRSVLLAGGIGVTPIRAARHHGCGFRNALLHSLEGAHRIHQSYFGLFVRAMGSVPF